MSGTQNLYHCPIKWHELSSTESGKFCEACQKPIADFTNLSNEDIKNKLLKEGSVCAKINTSQLNLSRIPSKISIHAVVLSIGIISAGLNGIAQEKIPTDSIKIHNTISNKIKIGGQIKDRQNSEPIVFANVILLDGNRVIAKTNSDFEGKYQFEISADSLPKKEITLRCTFVGYQSTEVKNIPIDKLKKQRIDLKVDVSPDVEILGIMIYEPFAPEHDFPFPSGKTYKREELNKRPK